MEGRLKGMSSASNQRHVGDLSKIFRPPVNWVAVKELIKSFHIEEPLLFTRCPYCIMVAELKFLNSKRGEVR